MPLVNPVEELAENGLPRACSGQTGNGNMAATQFLDSATPTSYSTPNTFGGLSRTVTALPSREPLHYATVKATGLRKFYAKMAKSFNRGSLDALFSNFVTPIRLKLPESLVGTGYLSTAWNNRKSGDMVLRNSGPKFTIWANFTFKYLPIGRSGVPCGPFLESVSHQTELY